MHRLFFAVFPTDAAIAAAVEIAGSLRRDGRTGKWVDPGRYHVTLLFVGTFATVSDVQVRALVTAAGTIGWPAFEVVLDHVRSFPGRRPPGVLAGSAQQPVEGLACALRTALTQAGIEHEAPRPYVPHLTLVYGDAGLPAPRSVAPVGWPVREFHLVESLGGVPALIRRARFALG